MTLAKVDTERLPLQFSASGTALSQRWNGFVAMMMNVARMIAATCQRMHELS
jgi:hypothetical protein